MSARFSELFTQTPDANQFPLFSNARPITAVLQPADALFIPSGWWHWVTSYDRNIAINIWHRPGADEARRNAAASFLQHVDTIVSANEFQARSFQDRVPVIVRTEETETWPCLHKWTDDYLVHVAGSRRFAVGVSQERQLFPFASKNHGTRLESMSMSEFISRSQAGRDVCYLAQNEDVPKMTRNDWQVPSFWAQCFEDGLFRTPFWFTYGGVEGVTSALHVDDYDNLLVQIAGRKQVLLFGPEQEQFLYPMARPRKS